MHDPSQSGVPSSPPVGRGPLPAFAIAASHRTLSICFACVVWLACSPGSDGSGRARTTPDDMVAVSRFLVTLDRLVAEAEPAELIEHVADDAVILPPGGPALAGKRAIAERYSELRDRFQLDIAHEVLEVDRFADVILSRGRVRGTLVPHSADRAIPLEGKYLLVLRQESDGSFRLWRYMVNAEQNSV